MGNVKSAYFRDSLQELAHLSETTVLCFYAPDRSLYVKKQIPPTAMAYYNTLSQLSCPELAIPEWTDAEDGVFVYRRYISGMTLAEYQKQHGGRIGEKQAVSFAAGIARGLCRLHKAGLVHRDINPNNILITEEKSVRIIDFGIVREVKPNTASDTVILGTPGFAAPEQFGFSQSDGRTDLYALGVLLNLMITGCFPGKALCRGETGRIVRKCIAIDAANRYQSAVLLLHDLNRLQKKLCKCGRPEPDGKRLFGTFDQIISAIPGIRSPHPAIVVLAVIGYLFCALLLVATIATTDGTADNIVLMAFSILFSTIIPFFFFNNFLGCYDWLPGASGSSEHSKKVLFKTLAAFSLLLGFCLFSAVSHIPSQP